MNSCFYHFAQANWNLEKNSGLRTLASLQERQENDFGGSEVDPIRACSSRNS